MLKFLELVHFSPLPAVLLLQIPPPPVRFLLLSRLVVVLVQYLHAHIGPARQGLVRPPVSEMIRE